MKTNIIRLLDARKVPFKLFQLPEEKLGALKTAGLLNVPPGSVFKTIVAVRQKPGKPVLAVISAVQQLDLKLLAEVIKEKKMTLPTEKEAEKLTGLQAGGISPLVLINQGFQVIIDVKAQKMETIHISGGRRGLNIQLPVLDLASLTGARFARIGKLPGDKSGM